MRDLKSESRRTVNRYHVAAIIYIVAATLAGIVIGNCVSPRLQASGWQIFHAYIAFMGFGTLMILGNQRALVPIARLIRTTGLRIEYRKAGVFETINVSLWIIWLMYLFQGLTGEDVFYYAAIVFGFVVIGCLLVYAQRLYGSVSMNSLWRNLPIRFFATSLFMCLLSYGQMVHITINEIRPVLPFSGTLHLGHNYLAFSIPISLTIMGSMYVPFYRALREGKVGSGRLWELQYGILVFGVFALFFALLFDNPARHGLFAALQQVFSAVLVLSIIVFAAAMLRDGPRLPGLPAAAKRFYFCAVFWLALAGAAGFLLGYGWDRQSPHYYFLIQTHIHFALIGWVGMGLTGVVYYVLSLSGRSEDAKSAAQFWLMNAGIIVFGAGVYFKSMLIRGAGGGLVAVSFLFLLSAVLAQYRGGGIMGGNQKH